MKIVRVTLNPRGALLTHGAAQPAEGLPPLCKVCPSPSGTGLSFYCGLELYLTRVLKIEAYVGRGALLQVFSEVY